jgi:uncharacterized protein involved in exopolysaccharide biosynthesis
MTAPLRIETNDAVNLRDHYEDLAFDMLRTIWRRKLLIAAIVVAALVLASIALILIEPRYKGEAMIQLKFSREEPVASTKNESIATVDAAALVDSAARVIRSRATAAAVVARLGLDKEADFAHESALWRAFSMVQTALGFDGARPSPRDLAVNELMRRVTVTSEPRSYLISVATTSKNPDQAAKLANAVALEYLRGQMLQQLADTLDAVERELNQLSLVYGERHPNYIVWRTRLGNLQTRLLALRDMSPTEDAATLVTGQSFVAAEKVTVPSSPNIILILGLTVGAALAMAIWLALLLRPDRAVGSQRLAVRSEHTLESIRK